MKRILSFLGVLLYLLTVISAPKTVTLTAAVTEDRDFGAAYIDLTPAAFEAAGFTLGDSVDLVFDNGFALEDVPYYNGYNARTGKPLICAYPSYPHPAVSFCSGEPLWEAAGLREGNTVTVTLREKGRYLSVHEAMNLVYDNDPAAYPSREAFANFRAMTGGALAENKFYRGASPVNNAMSRAPVTDALLEETGIRFVLDLADTEEKLAGFRAAADYASDYFDGLYAEGNVALLGLNASFRGERFMKTLAEGLRVMTAHEGPVYIHCLEGKDRTGFVCALLEALAGADYDELREDYMATYRNYYGITREDRPEPYAAVLSVKFEDIVQLLTGLPDGSDYSGDVLKNAAADYLLDCGMTEAEIEALTAYLCGE